jgi:DNA polymerase type B, organellar and viral
VRDVKAHYIRKNESARIPERFIILDTEACRERNSKGEVQSWALAVATFLTWSKKGTYTTSTSRFETPETLWSAVSDFTRTGRRTVLYAHNLNYDLRISQALSLLPKLGWNLKDMRLDGRGSWSKWSRDKASLNLCDSASIFPVSLEQLGLLLEMPKLPLPRSDQREKLFQRCERDVEILATAIIQYVMWLRSGQCGNWQMTGASQSWSHWRHSHYTHPILVHDNEEALCAERAAMHSGRCEAWRWGKYSGQPFYEYDWQNSYPRIARDCLLPTRLAGTVASPSAESLDALCRKYAVLADCEVTTDTPCVPTQSDGRTLWPTGTFRTTLWDPEICVLREAGATVRVYRAWLYKREPALKEWAEWILSSLHDHSHAVEGWKKLILKHWSRALIGRFGMRYSSWEHYATSLESRIYMSDLANSEDGSVSTLMQVGTDIFISGQQKEIDDGCPQITGYIMSEARAKLWRVAQQIGPKNVFYMDTDSLIVNSKGHERIQESLCCNLFDGLRSKGKFRSIQIFGPRSLITDNRPVVAGMPRGSKNMGSDTWSGEVWRGAKESVRLNEANIVSIRSTTFHLRYNSNRRHFEPEGQTVPYSLPGMVPQKDDRIRQTRSERLIANGYPAMLAHNAAVKDRNRLVTIKRGDADNL